MAVGTGFGLDLSAIDNALKEADNKIKSLTDKTHNLSKTTINAFQQMTNQGVIPYVESLKRQAKALENLGAAAGKSGLTTLQADAKLAVDEINKVVNALQKAYRREQSGKDALSFSKSVLSGRGEVKSIENMRLAIQKLEEAQNRQNLKTQTGRNNYKKIGQEIERVQLELRRATGENDSFIKSLGKVGKAVASAFSIQAIRGYINQMIKVRGEMELQQRSLQAILQNKDAANEVWQKTIDLAVRSPFRIKDLVTYTKQLAAYRVESEKLYDTNKMLADVSAGLGVDMNRLILAFGQVKSANFLRGTELRQFTEAGIPMLDELAKLYTQMEGALVTSGDVFERISKRMVLFEDVEEVFKRMTAAGGTFYRMQEIQSETLKGQISNLKDSVDIMLNSMGKDMDGVLKKSVRSVKFLVDNYQALIPVLKAIIAALALYKINTFQASSATLMYARNLGVAKASASGLGAIWATLRVSLNKFKIALGETAAMLVSNPWILLATAIATAAIKLYQFRKELQEVDKKYSQLLDKQGDVYLAFRHAGQKGDLEEQIAERRKQLQALVDMAKNEYGLVIDINVGEIDESKLEEEFNKIRQKMIDLNAFSASFTKEMIKSDKLSKWFGEESIYEEGLFEDIQDVGDSYEKLYQEMITKSGRITAKLRDDWENLTDAQKKAVEDLEKPIQGSENMIDYVERLKNAFLALNNTNAVKENGKISRFIRSFSRDAREAKVEFSLFASRFREEVDAISNEKEKIEFLDVSIGAIANEKEWSEFEENYIRRLVEQEFGITFVPKTATPEELKNWQKSYNALFKGDSGFREINAAATSQSQVIERLNGTYESLEETIKRIEAAGKDSILAGGAYEGQDLNKLKSDLAEVKKQLDWFGVGDKKGGSGKDEVLEKLKNRINLIKEMNKEYEKLNKTFSKAESLAKVQKAYADTAKELSLDTSTMDFTDEGTIKSLEALLGKPEYAANKYVIELQKALDNFKVELGVEVKQEKDQDLKAQVQELFDQYDLSLELKKLSIPKDLAKSLFDVDYLDLDGLKRAVQAQETKFIGTDMEKEYEDFLKKIKDLSRKQREDEAKEFVNFLKKNLNEIQVIQDKGAYNIALADRLFGEGKITAEQYLSSVRQIVEDTNREVARVNLEKFKDSATYIKAMGNLAAYSRDELEEMMNVLQGQVGANAGNMGADEIRAYYEALERLVEQYDKIESPFQKGEINDLIEYLNLQKQLNQEKEKEAALEQRKAELNARLMLLQNKLASQQASGDTEGAKFTQGLIKSAVNELKEVNGQIVSVASNILVISERVEALGDGMVKSLTVAHKIVNEIANVANAATKIFDDVKSAADALGADTESGGWAKAGYAMEMVGGVSSELTQGLANFASGNFAGALANVVGMVTKLISGFAKIHDQNYQDIIEAQAEQVERLGKAYEKLETATESAYSIQQLQQYNEELERNVELQIASYKAMIAAEQAKKNTDDEQIAAWNEELVALTEQWEALKASLLEGVGGVSKDNYRSQTREFVDAWVSAFKETGDGLQGLKDNFREFFDNIIAEQAAMRVTETFLEPFYESLNEALKDYELTVQESKDLREMVEKIAPDLSSALEKIWGQLGGSGGAEAGGLSALQKGIQGVSEETAQVIEAYLNSIRGYVSEQVTHTRNIYRILNDAVHSDAAAIRVRMV